MSQIASWQCSAFFVPLSAMTRLPSLPLIRALHDGDTMHGRSHVATSPHELFTQECTHGVPPFNSRLVPLGISEFVAQLGHPSGIRGGTANRSNGPGGVHRTFSRGRQQSQCNSSNNRLACCYCSASPHLHSTGTGLQHATTVLPPIPSSTGKAFFLA